MSSSKYPELAFAALPTVRSRLEGPPARATNIRLLLLERPDCRWQVTSSPHHPGILTVIPESIPGRERSLQAWLNINCEGDHIEITVNQGTHRPPASVKMSLDLTYPEIVACVCGLFDAANEAALTIGSADEEANRERMGE